MIVLGIHDGHNASATILKDGKILSSIQEERLTRKKNEVGFPIKAIQESLKITNIKKKDIDYLVYSSKFMHDKKYLKNPLDWYKIGFKDQIEDGKKPKYYKKIIFDKRKQERIQIAKQFIGISSKNIHFLDHHLCHIASGYYCSSHPKNKKTLGISLDGSGDNLAGTVYICKNNDFQKLSFTKRDASLGKIYSRITALMGMKPWEHEYKVMGLAPYADEQTSKKIEKEVLDKLIYVDKKKLRLRRKSKLSMNYCYEFLSNKLMGQRFDNIAGATQKFTEKIIFELITAALKKTKIKNLVLGGGVFMNVKANNIISKIKNIKNLFIMPSSGDESLSIGAAMYFYYKKTNSKNFKYSILKHLYYGKKFSKDEENKLIKKLDKNKFIIHNKNLNLLSAKLLSKNYVLGRCAGRSEWGSRALGNRSILARADKYEMVNTLNDKIKNRDFWMPFAPIILDTYADRYLIKKKCNFNSSFMTMVYELNKKNYKDLVCGTHVKDQTARPQVLSRKVNDNLYDLIHKYSKINKSGCLINTSFNLHGFPIVDSPHDALQVFKRSKIDALLLNYFLVVKKT